MNKLKDVAGLLKAKITKDELEEALINATSQQNWQASTHILHEIANAAYNYEKWQQINEFIWDKLKKGKSWRKILKTLNLVEFLLKNGPPSIISSFKYDIYQFRSFDNFSHYDDGIDRGESIRQKAKAVVDLLSNEEMLEEQRLKAKTIRERMSGVVSGSNYGGFNNKQSSISSSKYGSIDNKSYQSGGFTNPSSGYNQSGLGVYGDYGTTKSTLDKYKDNKPTATTMTKKPVGSTINQPLNEDPKEKEKQMVVDNKKPFQSIAPKLVKPGSKPAPKQQTNIGQKPTSNKNIIDDVDIFGNDTVTPVQHTPVQQPVQQQYVQPTQPVQNTSPMDFGFSFQTQATKPQPVQPPVQQPVQPPVQQPVQVPAQQLYQQQQTNIPANFNNLNVGGFNNQQQFPQQQPNLYGQQQFGGYGQQQQPSGQFGMMGGYQQQPIQQQGLYGQPYQQPMMQGQMGMGGYNQNLGFNAQQPHYQQANQFQQQQSWNQGISLSTPTQPTPQQNLGGISLQTTTTHQKKDEDEFGNFSSGQNANVKWLTSEEKGLIDFSDFGDELKNGGQKQQKNNSTSAGNNIDTTWNW